MIDPEIKSAWVAALRSGEYEQGFMALNSRGMFCCLGVLADVYVKKGEAEWNPISVNTKSCLFKTGGTSGSAFLPAGILPTGVQATLTSANDCGKSFGFIATLIEGDSEI